MNVLDDIVAGVRLDLLERERAVPLRELVHRLDDAPAAREVLSSLAAPGLSVIAEVKRASPSKGALADISDPAALAAEYAAGGANAISVLTEQRRFRGSLADLDAVRARVQVPVLRKDFMVSEYQLVEARVHGADLCLLIVAMVDPTELRRLYGTALDLGLTPLVEAHTPDETRQAVDLGAQLIGINNRNLKTLDVDIEQFGRMAGLVPAGIVRVAESGILTPADVRTVRDAGADAVLVGEALVRHQSPRTAVAYLRGDQTASF